MMVFRFRALEPSLGFRISLGGTAVFDLAGISAAYNILGGCVAAVVPSLVLIFQPSSLNPKPILG